MMKGLFFAALIFIASGVFALDLHLGGGAAVGYTMSDVGTYSTMLQYGSFSVQGSGIDFYYKEAMSLWYKTSTWDVGAFVFADCTYAELAVGYLGQLGTIRDQHSTRQYNQEVNGIRTDEEEESYVLDDAPYTSSLVFVDLLGRLPFTVGRRLSLFFALGGGFNFAVGGNGYSDYERALFWALNVKAGGGLDYRLSGRLFLRGELLFSYRIAFDQDGLFDWGGQMGKDMERKIFKMTDDGYFLGPQLRIALGYTFPLGGSR
jgi:hypothetical protein